MVFYDQGVWAQMGEACCVSILDLFGHNCHSRVLYSPWARPKYDRNTLTIPYDS